MVYLQYEPGYNHANYGIFVVYVIYILHITGIYAVYIQYILKHPWLIQGYSYFFFNSGQSRDTRRLVPSIRRQTRRIRPARHGVRTPGLHPELPKAKNIQRFSKPMHTNLLVTSSVSWRLPEWKQTPIAQCKAKLSFCNWVSRAWKNRSDVVRFRDRINRTLKNGKNNPNVQRSKAK